jgi:large subunit ribosomal protein L35
MPQGAKGRNREAGGVAAARRTERRLASARRLGYISALRTARRWGACPWACRGGPERSIPSFRCERPPSGSVRVHKESKMPKQKTKSGAKKRFKFTANGHVKVGQAGKRHGMIKRTKKFIRSARGTMVLAGADERIVKVYMPYNR